ncbi:MAG: sulfite exporter TauE/SafE family protein [Candidatus Helarchaeota archaeon]
MVDIEIFILIIVIAIGIGFLASLFGIGGGFLLYPTMIFIAGMNVHATIGTIPFVIEFMAISSSIAYARQKKIDYSITSMLVGASVIGAILGALVSVQISGQILVILFGIVELILAIILGITKTPHEKSAINKNNMKKINSDKKEVVRWYIISRHKKYADGQEYYYKANILISIPLSFIAGFLSSLLGIGGGSLYIQIFAFFCGMPIHMAIACSIFSIFISTMSSAITFVMLNQVDFIIGISLIIGMVIGAQIGAFTAHKIKSKYLKPMAAIMISIIAIQMIIFAIVGKPT